MSRDADVGRLNSSTQPSLEQRRRHRVGKIVLAIIAAVGFLDGANVVGRMLLPAIEAARHQVHRLKELGTLYADEANAWKTMLVKPTHEQKTASPTTAPTGPASEGHP
jgi:hypothetical protein